MTTPRILKGNTGFKGPKPWIDVLAYGAVGDGTANDTAAIQAAIDASTGGVVYLPPGTYNVSYLSMDTGITLRGAGPSTILSATSTNAGHGVIDVYSKNNWAIEDLKIDGQSESGTLLASTCGIIVQETTAGSGECTNFRISNVWLYDCNLRALNLRSGIDGVVENILIEGGCTETALLCGPDHSETSDVQRVRFNNITVKDVLCDGVGIYTYDTTGSVHDLAFNGIAVSSCGNSSAGHGFFLTGGVTDITVSNFALADGQHANGNGFYFEGGARHSIFNGSVRGFLLYGLAVGGGAPTDCNISNVTLYQCQRGVVIEPNTNPTAARFSFNNVRSIESDYDGWYIAGSNHTFTNCSSTDDAQEAGTYSGFLVQSAVVGAAPTGLIFTGCRSSGADYGINFGDYCATIYVDGTSRFSGTTQGIYYSAAGSENDVAWGVARYVTGTGTIANGAVYADVTHGLAVADYSAADIVVNFKENPTNSPGAVWIDTVGASTFRVNVENDPGASGFDFAWRITQRS